MSSLPSIDPTKLYFLMALGVIFALAGVYLMVRPQSADGETRIEIFGLKFNISSGGLVVFLVGASFVAFAVVAPESRAPQSVVASGSASDVGQASLSGFSPVPIGGSEQEPNDVSRAANIIEPGFVISGEAKAGDTDFFVLNLDSGRGALRIIWRVLDASGGNNPLRRCELAILDKNNERIDSLNTPKPKEARSYLHTIAYATQIFLKLQSFDETECNYEIELNYEDA